MIDPIDEDEREQLLRELVVERFGSLPRRPGSDESPQVIARRRRVLCGMDAERPQKRQEAA